MSSGVTVVVEGTEPIQSDVVFVHGLGGDSAGTWTSSTPTPSGPSKKRCKFNIFSFTKTNSGSSGSSAQTNEVFWPRDFLAEDLPNIRVLSYGYPSEAVHIFGAANQNGIYNHAQNMLHALQGFRRDTSRPVIFVCHSLGGIIVKQVLLLSKEAEYQRHLQSLYSSTYGIIFLGTPHRGADLAGWAKIIGNLSLVAFQGRSQVLGQELEVGSGVLKMISDGFSRMVKGDRIWIHSFHEERPMTGFAPLSDLVVPEFSSIIGDAAEGSEGINANHVNMCKFKDRKEAGYVRVKDVVERFITEANDLTIGATEAMQFLPAQVRQRIERDKDYNRLQYVPSNGTVSISIPSFSDAILNAPSGYHIPTRIYPGSCAYELADVLQLLPHQGNTHLANFEEVALQNLPRDDETYYAKVSSHGLVRLISNNLSRIDQENTKVIARTTIGTFTFIYSDVRTVVRFNARERSEGEGRRYPLGQDMEPIRLNANRRWRCRGNADGSAQSGREPSQMNEPPFWSDPIPLRVAVIYQNLDHPQCIRYMNAAEYSALTFYNSFSGDLLATINHMASSLPEIFGQRHYEFPLAVMANVQDKELSKISDFPIVLQASQGILSTIVAGPNDDPARLTPSNSIRLISRSHAICEDTERVYRQSQSRMDMQNRLRSYCDNESDAVIALGTLALLMKANSSIMLLLTVKSPRKWLDLVTQPDITMLIG